MASNYPPPRYSDNLEDWPSIVYLYSLDLRTSLLHMAQAVDTIPDGWKQLKDMNNWSFENYKALDFHDIPIIKELGRLTTEDLHSGGSFGTCFHYILQLAYIGWDDFVKTHIDDLPA